MDMRILRKECRKILNPRLLLVIAIFTFFYYQAFMRVENVYNGPRYDSFDKELLEETGPTLSSEDLPALYNRWDQLIMEFNQKLAEEGSIPSDVIEELGTDFYEHFWYTSGEESEELKQLLSKVHEILQMDEEMDEIFSRMWHIHFFIIRIEEDEGLWFSVPEQDAEEWILQIYGSFASPLYLKAKTLFCQREMSSLPGTSTLWEDTQHLAVLLVICCLLLLVPYQIQERHREVLPLYASTHTGRKIFGMQFAAGLLSCGFLCAVQMFVFLWRLHSCGDTMFWNCPAWPGETNELWITVTFGTYVIINMVMVWLFALGATVLAYWIGRCVSNYVAGIAVSIPAGGAIGYLGTVLFRHLFFFYYYVRVPLWELLALILWLAAMSGFLALILKRDRKRAL